MQAQHAHPQSLHTCDYCGLAFRGSGYSPGDGQRFCCYGCCLVQRIIGNQGDGGIAAWLLVRLGIGAFLAMNVMMLSMVLYFDPTGTLGADAVGGLRWAMAILATPAWLILSGPFVGGCAKDLGRGRLSTDSLIVTGSTAAYGVSMAHVIAGRGAVYFDTATMLLVIVTLGRLIEASAKARTAQALRDTMGMIPDTARVVRDGDELEIPAGEIEVGDMLVVRPGERIPADGRIVTGNCMIEEAAFTGEARPRSVGPGDRVFGGSVNCDGLITVEATAVGSDSLLSGIRRMVEQAEINLAPIERLTERAASVFLPLVWTLAIGSAVFWSLVRHDPEKAVLSGLAVLVVACPCALGLATPMAAAIAIGKAAGAGVLIRSSEVLEYLPKIDLVFFDKTGTLTDGRLHVTDILTADGVSRDEALAWGGQLESASEHAIARAIVDAAETRGLPAGSVTDFQAFPGLGAEGLVAQDHEVRLITVGSLKLLSHRHRVPDELALDAGDLYTTAFIGWDGVTRAAILLGDSPRPEARYLADELHAMGIESAVISGDGQAPTLRLADQLGIDLVYSEFSPGEKVEMIREARQMVAGGVAMVGDGINDAPALAEADVGIAIGGGTDLARESSDVTLVGDDLSRIPWLLDLARRTCRVIRRNLWWAFGYNAVAVCMAAMGFVHPLIAAAAMFASSFFVIANSMSLLRRDRPHTVDDG